MASFASSATLGIPEHAGRVSSSLTSPPAGSQASRASSSPRSWRPSSPLGIL